METNNSHSPEKSFSNTVDKDTNLKNHEKTIFHYLQNHVATTSMVSEATGIPKKSICRYKRDLEKLGLLFEVEKKICKITGFKAWYLTTNLDLLPMSNPKKNVRKWKQII